MLVTAVQVDDTEDKEQVAEAGEYANAAAEAPLDEGPTEMRSVHVKKGSPPGLQQHAGHKTENVQKSLGNVEMLLERSSSEESSISSYEDTSNTEKDGKPSQTMYCTDSIPSVQNLYPWRNKHGNINFKNSVQVAIQGRADAQQTLEDAFKQGITITEDEKEAADKLIIIGNKAAHPIPVTSVHQQRKVIDAVIKLEKGFNEFHKESYCKLFDKVYRNEIIQKNDSLSEDTNYYEQLGSKPKVRKKSENINDSPFGHITVQSNEPCSMGLESDLLNKGGGKIKNPEDPVTSGYCSQCQGRIDWFDGFCQKCPKSTN